MAGAFDNLNGIKRSAFFAGENENDDTNFIEKLIKYGHKIQEETNSAQQSLFGEMGGGSVVQKPRVPDVEEWAKLILLEKEKNLIGIYLTAHPLDDYKLEINNFCSRDVALKDLNNNIERFKDRDFVFGGMVTAAREGQSKNGNMYATLTLSDYTDSKEIFFFGNDYVNFGKFCKAGIFIMVKGTVRSRFGSSDFYEFKVNSIELLSDVRSSYVKSITINVPLPVLNKNLVKNIESLAKDHQGKSLLKFNVFDPENNMHLEMFSRTARVYPSDAFLNFFEEQPEMSYRIN
jgi:DNA polymerase-3 subunit alpha